MEQELLTPAQAAQLREVSRTSIYKAIHEGRLPCERVLNRLALKRSDVLAWEPQRPGLPRKSVPMSKEGKKKLSESQKKIGKR